MSKIESYDVIESKDDDLSNLIQKYSNLNLTYDIPGTTSKRSLLFESDVKYKDAMTSSKVKVQIFFFFSVSGLRKREDRHLSSKISTKNFEIPD